MHPEQDGNTTGRDEKAPPSPPRRYDVDWIRTLAIGLLIVFHIALSFQSWASATGFPQNDVLLEGLLPLVTMLAVWRIPLLFLVSGMGVRFAMERRGWKEILKDRAIRILLPYLFGIAALGPVLSVLLPYLGWDAPYIINFGHLWFLLNISLYVAWLVGVMTYLKDAPENAFLRALRRVIQWPLGLFLFALPLMLEAGLVDPEYFSLYVDTLHGWLAGLICFFTGFLFIATQEVFWPAVGRTRWIALGLAVTLFLGRFLAFGLADPYPWLTALESMSWILAVLGFGSVHLNKTSRSLRYLTPAAYPVYIVHLPVQFALAYFVLTRPISAYMKLTLMLVGTFGISLLLYELVLRRLKWVRPLFGIKLNQG